MKKIFVDMDGVLAEYKKDCTAEDMAKKGYFRSLSPQDNMLSALEMLTENCDSLGVRVCVLTKVYPKEFKYSVREKLEWRDEYMPYLFDSEFVMVNGDEQEKSDAVTDVTGKRIDGDCILIDDYNENLRQWSADGGVSVKFVNEINDKNKSFVGSRISCNMTAEEIYSAILALLGLKNAPKAA